MKYTIIKNGLIHAVVSGDPVSIAACYVGCEIIEGDHPPTEFSYADGGFVRNPQVVIPPPYVPTTEEQLEEQRHAALRIRATLLAKSDWTQLPDVPEATRLLWQPYRQALRDLPAQPGWPQDCIWPDAPASN